MTWINFLALAVGFYVLVGLFIAIRATDALTWEGKVFCLIAWPVVLLHAND